MQPEACGRGMRLSLGSFIEALASTDAIFFTRNSAVGVRLLAPASTHARALFAHAHTHAHAINVHSKCSVHMASQACIICIEK